jgi:hypothetical protein
MRLCSEQNVNSRAGIALGSIIRYLPRLSESGPRAKRLGHLDGSIWSFIHLTWPYVRIIGKWEPLNI